MSCPGIQPFCIMPPKVNGSVDSITNVGTILNSDANHRYDGLSSLVPYSNMGKSGPLPDYNEWGYKICDWLLTQGEWYWIDRAVLTDPNDSSEVMHSLFSASSVVPEYPIGGQGETSREITGYLEKPFTNGGPVEKDFLKNDCYDPNRFAWNSVCGFTKFMGSSIPCCLNNMYCSQTNPQNTYLGTHYPGVFDDNCFNWNTNKTPDIGFEFKTRPTTCPFNYRRLGDNGFCTDTTVDTGCDSCYNQMLHWCSSSDPIDGKNTDANVNMPEKWTQQGYTFPDVFQKPLNQTTIPPLKTYNMPCTNFMLSTLYSTITEETKYSAPVNEEASECNIDRVLEFMNQETPVPTDINPSNYQRAKLVFTTAVRKYLEAGGKLDAIEGEDGSNEEFNALVYKICNSYPGLCTELLGDFCSNKSPEDLTRNPSTASFCGCYLNPLVYEGIAGKFGINRECSSFCNIEGVLPLSDGTFTGSKRCNQSVCMIDNVSINIVDSRIDGAINLGNICGNCPTGTVGSQSASNCECILDNITVDIVNSSISTINLQQSCSKISCYSTNPNNNNRTRIDCNTGEPIRTELQEKQRESSIYHNLKIIGLILLFVILIVIIYFLIRPTDKIPDIVNVNYPKSLPAVSTRPYRSLLDRR